MVNHLHNGIVSQLQAAGFRLTKLRTALIEIFTSQSQPVTRESLQASLRERGVAFHRISLYRELEFLAAQNLIVAVSLPDGKLRYEFADSEHHHHLVCTQCKKIAEIVLDDDFQHFEKFIAAKHHFAVNRHSLEFFGVCINCQ